MLRTQNYLWQRDGRIIATLEVRHHNFEMVLNVDAEVAQKVRAMMVELNELGTYPYEETTSSGGLSAQFIISGGYNWNSRWRDFQTNLNRVLGIIGTKVLRKIGVSYSNGWGTTCPGCGGTIRVRNKETARIFVRVTCEDCGESFEIVIPEDPERRLTNEDLARKTSAHWRNIALAFYRDNPDVIPSPMGLRMSVYLVKP